MVELMIVCVIMVIISAIAVPNIVMMNRNYKLECGRAFSCQPITAGAHAGGEAQPASICPI